MFEISSVFHYLFTKLVSEINVTYCISKSRIFTHIPLVSVIHIIGNTINGSCSWLLCFSMQSINTTCLIWGWSSLLLWSMETKIMLFFSSDNNFQEFLTEESIFSLDLGLKTLSLMSNRGPSQNFQNLFSFAYFHSSSLTNTLPKLIKLKSFQYEMREIYLQM